MPVNSGLAAALGVGRSLKKPRNGFAELARSCNLVSTAVKCELLPPREISCLRNGVTSFAGIP